MSKNIRTCDTCMDSYCEDCHSFDCEECGCDQCDDCIVDCDECGMATCKDCANTHEQEYHSEDAEKGTDEDET